MDLTAISLLDAAGLVADRKVSPMELTLACLDRIEALDTQINSFITVTSEQALVAAQRAEDEILSGNYRGPLHGIPLAVKDCFDTEGIRTTAGSDFWRNRVPDGDATAIRHLADAGAILLGKLNMHEWAWGTTNVNPHYGTCLNPWNTAHVAGGSSGGPAAGLAARFVFGALGTDSGGSIRTPASFCGVAGLKPTFGRVSLSGVAPHSWSLDHAGPMARSVSDLAELLQAIAGFDSADPRSSRRTAEDYSASLGGGVKNWRVALLDLGDFSEVDPEVANAARLAAEVFTELGASVIEVDVPGLRDARQANRIISAADALAFHKDRIRAEPERFGSDVLERLRDAENVTAVEYAAARHEQRIFRRQFDQFFDDFDVLLSPAAPVTAPLVEPPEGQPPTSTSISLFASPFNLTGLPALSVPCGFNGKGLPIGLQLAAGPWQEARLLQAAAAYESATSWHGAAPQL